LDSRLFPIIVDRQMKDHAPALLPKSTHTGQPAKGGKAAAWQESGGGWKLCSTSVAHLEAGQWRYIPRWPVHGHNTHVTFATGAT
jgi:hypothetical protein